MQSGYFLATKQGAVCVWSGSGGGTARERRGTYAVREVRNQVLDFDLADLELAVKPAGSWVSSVEQCICNRSDAHHFVNVFC